MSDENGPGPETPDDIDTGRPLTALLALEERPRPGFLTRLRNRIARRTMTSQVAVFSWDGLRIVVLEFLELIFSFFGPKRDREGGAS